MPHSKESIEQKIIDILTIQLGTPGRDISPNSTRASLGMDSLDDVEVILAIEEEFGLEISAADAEKLLTVQDAVRYVASKIQDAYLRPRCGCHGCPVPDAICGYVIVGGKECGAPVDFECEHKEAGDVA